MGNIYLFTQDKQYIFKALHRYLKLIFNIELKLFGDKSNLSTFNDNIWVLEEEKDRQPFIIYLAKNKTINVILVGVNNNCQINLMRFHDLRIQIETVLQKDRSSVKPVFTKDELCNKITSLFKSHGRVSISQLLNSVEYSLKNYKLYEQGLMNWDDYKTQFVDPVITGWELFKQRFDQHWPYLLLLDFDHEVETILQNIQAFNPFWIEFISMETSTDSEISMKVTNALQLFEKINNTLAQISSRIGII